MPRANFSTSRARIRTHMTDSEALMLPPRKALANGNTQLTRRADVLKKVGSVREKAMAPPSSTLAWKIPWTEEPVRLQSMGLLRVGHD